MALFSLKQNPLLIFIILIMTALSPITTTVSHAQNGAEDFFEGELEDTGQAKDKVTKGFKTVIDIALLIAAGGATLGIVIGMIQLLPFFGGRNESGMETIKKSFWVLIISVAFWLVISLFVGFAKV